MYTIYINKRRRQADCFLQLANRPTPAFFFFPLFSFWQQQVNILVETVTSPLSPFSLLHPTAAIAPAICSGVQELKLQHRLSLPTPLSLSICH